MSKYPWLAEGPETHEIRRRKAVEWESKNDSPQYGHLLDHLTTACREHAERNGVDAEQFEHGLLRQALDAASDIRSALVPYTTSSDEEAKFRWHHASQPLHLVQTKKIPHIDRGQIEAAAGGYLDLPFRCSAVDRLLVDVLVARELYSFADEMLNEETFGVFPARSPLKHRHPVVGFLIGQAIDKGIFGGILAMIILAGHRGWISESWAIGLAIAVVCWIAISFLVALVTLPAACRQHRKAKQRVADLLGSMVDAYRELASDGPISVNRVRSLVDKAASTGVVWPAPLFVMLDDIGMRSGRF